MSTQAHTQTLCKQASIIAIASRIRKDLSHYQRPPSSLKPKWIRWPDKTRSHHAWPGLTRVKAVLPHVELPVKKFTDFGRSTLQHLISLPASGSSRRLGEKRAKPCRRKAPPNVCFDSKNQQVFVLATLATKFDHLVSASSPVNNKGLHQGRTQTSLYLEVIHFTSRHTKSHEFFF